MIGDFAIIRCENCGIDMRDSDTSRHEMQLHEAECDWPDDPIERFEKGDTVQYSDFGLYRLGREPRTGEVIGFSRDPHLVRVRWAGNQSTSTIAHSFVKKLEDVLGREQYCPSCDDETVHNSHGSCIDCFASNYE